MSAFVIDKKEYMKAAGFVAGLAKDYEMWVWDYENGRNKQPEDYQRDFDTLYKMNLQSVGARYNSAETADERDCFEDFVVMFNKAHKMYLEAVCDGKSKELLTALYKLLQFFDSVKYQNCGEQEAERVTYATLNGIIAQITGKVIRRLCYVTDELGCWGTFEI